MKHGKLIVGLCILAAVAPPIMAQDQTPSKEVITIPKEQYQKMLQEHQKLLEEMKEMKAFKTRLEESQKTPSKQQAETDQALDDLEKQLKAVKQMAKDSFPGSTKMLLTGYGSATYTATGNGYGPATPVGPDDRAGRSFFSATFNPIFLWKLSDRLLFEGEMELQLEGSDTSVALEMAQISYVLNDYMTLGAGKFLNPMNYFVERQHMAWVNKLPDKPLAVYDGLLSESLLGAQVRGAIPVGPIKLGYSAFVANAPTVSTDTNAPMEIGTLAFDNFENVGNHTAVGGRLGVFPLPELEVGYGFQYSGVGPAGTPVNAWLHSVDATYVRESELLRGIINVHGQWVWSRVENNATLYDPNAPSPLSNNRDGGYIQLAYRPTRLPNHILASLEPVLRYDVINQRKTPVGFDENRWTVGLNYWLGPSAVVKAAYEFDHQNGSGQSGNAFLLQVAVGF